MLLSGVAAAQTPHLTGTVATDPRRGLLNGDVCLSALPERDTLHFLLHNGLNVRAVRDGTGRPLPYSGYYDGRMIGEGLRYTVIDTARGRRSLCVGYTGAFPVYPGRDNAHDFKGAIAFDGRTVRASEQAKWYPVLYDSASARRSDVVTYHLRVTCAACSAIYLAGSAPVRGDSGEFSSMQPRPLLLFAGDYSIRESDGTRFLNGSVAPEEMRRVGRSVGEVERFYTGVVGLPFRDSLTLIESPPLDQVASPGRVWGFTSWPAIFFIGLPFSDLARGLAASDTATEWVLPFVAHEMAHYYFGTVVRAPGPLKGFYVESTAEYLALRAIHQFRGDSVYHAAVRARWRDARCLANWVPLNRVVTDGEIGDAYRYRYGPLLLVALERDVGTERVDRMLHMILTSPSSALFDYGLLRRAAAAAGIPSPTWEAFERRCVTAAPAASCLTTLTTSP